MKENIVKFIYNFIKGFYIGLLFITCSYIMYKPTIDKLTIIINEIKRKQDILYKCMCKIKEIINIDNDLSSEQFIQIKAELDKINEIILNIGTHRESNNFEIESSNSNTPIRYQ